MKKCRVCLTDKDESEFSSNNAKSDGLNAECKECQKIYFKNYYKNNKQKHILRVKKITKNKNNIIREIKLNSKCCRCGFDNPAALQFHHRDQSAKLFTIGNAGKNQPLESLLKEIEKCDIICANCHMIEHYSDSFANYEKSDIHIKVTKKRPHKKRIRICSLCLKEHNRISKTCIDCSKIRNRKVLRPSKEELETMQETMSIADIAKKYNVSWNAVKKWFKFEKAEYKSRFHHRLRKEFPLVDRM